jgi:hypothetical protein
MTVICICAIERHQAPSSAIELTASKFGGECETAKTTTLHTQSTHMMCTSKRCCMRKARKRWVWERDVLCLPEKSRTDSYSSVLLNHTPRPGVEGEGEYVLFLQWPITVHHSLSETASEPPPFILRILSQQFRDQLWNRRLQNGDNADLMI